MKRKKLIGVIIGKVFYESSRKILNGIISQAYSLDCNVAIFTLIDEKPHFPAHYHGEKNILNLINFDLLDGVLIVPSTLASPGLSKEIFQLVTKKCKVPVVYVNEVNHTFPYVLVDDTTAFEQIVCHMIEAHGYKKIYCLTGQKVVPQSKLRVEAYKNALKKHGIPINDDYIFYGDYWKESAQILAKQIISGQIEKPDAIVCANDIMAITLCDTFIENGINVPNDIAISGYDGIRIALYNIPKITTFIALEIEAGMKAMCKLYEYISEKTCNPCKKDYGALEIGTSCGCNVGYDQTQIKCKQDLKELLEYEDSYVDSNIAVSLYEANNLGDFIKKINGFTYLIKNLSNFYLCLCDNWDMIEEDNETGYQKNGYSQTITIVNAIGEKPTFQSTEMLPQMFTERENCSTFYFTPVHFNDRCFGYSVLEYSNIVESFDYLYRYWCQGLNSGLEFIRVQNHLKSFNSRVYLSSIRDALTGIYNKNSSERFLRETFERSVNDNTKLLILVADIDSLKQINDNYGQLEGDNAITIIANALNTNCNNGEICIRTGGDEFMVLGSKDYGSQELERIIKSIKNYINKYNESSHKHYKITVSIGYFCDFVKPNEDLEMPIKIANSDMQKAKKNNKTNQSIPHYVDLIELRDMIYHKPQEKWTIDKMCTMLNLSRSYFQSVYRKAFGVSCMIDVIESKIRHSKKLLTTTEYSIAEIAQKCGYDDATYFMRQFKKYVNLTPSKYRSNFVSNKIKDESTTSYT